MPRAAYLLDELRWTTVVFGPKHCNFLMEDGIEAQSKKIIEIPKRITSQQL